MKLLIVPFVIFFAAISGFPQADLQKLVETEHAFARMAADKGNKPSFLAYMTDDALVFTPQKTNAKQFWTARQPRTGTLLSWAPNFADISGNGALGYTTGNWEFRANAKDETPAGFGDFITLWSRQPDGTYKWIIDIGVEHGKPDKYSTEWTSSKNAVAGAKEKIKIAPLETSEFFQLATTKGLARAYEKFADDNVRACREGKLPILGKKNVIKILKDDKAAFSFAKRGVVFGSDDVSYTLTEYERKLGEKVEKGNYLQIWKFYGGKWHIVLEIFKPSE
jgi:ketosteroid isomerase-like protein